MQNNNENNNDNKNNEIVIMIIIVILIIVMIIKMIIMIRNSTPANLLQCRHWAFGHSHHFLKTFKTYKMILKSSCLVLNRIDYTYFV